jgi:hypothetical protein
VSLILSNAPVIVIAGLAEAQFAAIMARFDALSLSISTFQNKELLFMSKTDDAIVLLTSQVAAEETVEDSAIALINGIPALIATAVGNAQAQGATDAQLASFTSLGASLTAKSAQLAAAVTANTTPPSTPQPGA